MNTALNWNKNTTTITVSVISVGLKIVWKYFRILYSIIKVWFCSYNYVNIMKASSCTCLLTTLQKFAINSFKSLNITVLEFVGTGSQDDSMLVVEASTTGWTWFDTNSNLLPSVLTLQWSLLSTYRVISNFDVSSLGTLSIRALLSLRMRRSFCWSRRFRSGFMYMGASSLFFELSKSSTILDLRNFMSKGLGCSLLESYLPRQYSIRSDSRLQSHLVLSCFYNNYGRRSNHGMILYHQSISSHGLLFYMIYNNCRT